MVKPEEFFEKDDLTKKYSSKPFPKLIKYIGWIKELNEFEKWLKAQTLVMLKWIGTYLVILPFFIFFCLSALGLFYKTTPLLSIVLLAEGISIAWYLLLSLIKDIRGAIKNG